MDATALKKIYTNTSTAGFIGFCYIFQQTFCGSNIVFGKLWLFVIHDLLSPLTCDTYTSR